jgi:small-conductance mechanosensitive channel
MADKAVDVLFTCFGDAGMDFRVRWWIAPSRDERCLIHRVYSVIQDMSTEKGIELLDTTFAVFNTIKIRPEDIAAISIAPVPDQPKQYTADASNVHID